MTALATEKRPTPDEVRAQMREEARVEAAKKHGQGIKAGTPEAQMYDNLLTIQSKGGFGGSGVMHSLDYTEAVQPILYQHLRSNRQYWKSRTMSSGWVIRSGNTWIRANGLAETQRGVVNALEAATESVKAESLIRAESWKADPRVEDYTTKLVQGSTTALRRSLRSYGSMMTTARPTLTKPPEWFTAVALEWALTVCDRYGEVPETITVADLARAYKRSQYPSGLSFDEDIRDELEWLGLVRNHSGIFKIHLGHQDVRDVICERLVELTTA